MKKYLLLFVCVCGFFFSCKEELNESYSIDDQEKIVAVSGEVLIEGSPNQFFLNIKLMKDFFLVSDHTNDTVLYVYRNEDVPTLFTSYLHKEKGGDFINPEFEKSVISEETGTNRSILIDDRTFIKDLFYDDRQEAMRVVQRPPLRSDLVFGSYYNFTSTDLYAVPGDDINADAIFYMFAKHMYYWVRPPMLNGRKISVDNLYLNSLCVNESKNSVVAGMRFINQVLFYDLDAKLQTTVLLGDSLRSPVIKQGSTKGPAVDIPKSTNHTIDIYGTPDYVFCLYDGTVDFKGISVVYVFSWDGKHIRTLKTGQNLKRIAIDKKNKYMLAIAENGSGKRDIVRYALKRKL